MGLGLISMSWKLIALGVVSFPICSVIGHKVVEKNEIYSSEDRKYGLWPLRSAFTFTHRVWMGK